MKDKVKKILAWRPGPQWYTCGMLGALILILIPLIYLAQYAVPWYDDYTYGRYARMEIGVAPDLLHALQGAWECIRMSWYAWQGTYGSIFFMVLMPGVWGEQYYRLGPMFLIVFLAVSVLTIVYTLLRTVLKAERIQAIGIAAVTSALALVMIHTAQEGFYWYNGGIHYVGMHGFAMLLVAASVRLLYVEKKGYYIAGGLCTCLLAMVVAGGNYVTALQGLLVMLSVIVLGFIFRKKNALFLLPALAVYILGFGLNTTAPGNAVRAESYVGWGMSPVEAIFHSFTEGFKLSREFTGWMTVLFLALMLPMVRYMVSRVSFRFPLPGLVTIWSVCLYATGFTPSLYSLGHAGLDRALNAVKITWQLMLVLNLVYWCGWLVARKERESEVKMCRWWCYLLAGISVLVIFHTETNQAGSFSPYGAYYYIHTGEAYNYYQEYLERVELLKGDEKVVVLKPYVWRPWFLCKGDLSDNPKDESNEALAEWYGKSKVICSSDPNLVE